LPAGRQQNGYTTTLGCCSLAGCQDARRRHATDTQKPPKQGSTHQEAERHQGHPLLWEAHDRGQEAGVMKDATRTGRRGRCAVQVACEPPWPGARQPGTREGGLLPAQGAGASQQGLATCHHGTFGAGRCQVPRGSHTPGKAHWAAGPARPSRGPHNQQGACLADKVPYFNGL